MKISSHAELIASVPALIRRVPKQGDVAIVFWGEGKVIAAAASDGDTIAETPRWLPMAFSETRSEGFFVVTYELNAEQAFNVASVLEPLLDQMTDCYAMSGNRATSFEHGHTVEVPDWRDVELTAESLSKGLTVAADRAEVEAETRTVDASPTPEQAALIESMEDVDVRDRWLRQIARLEVEKLLLETMVLTETYRVYPTAAVASLIGTCHYLAGDGMRANIWVDKALSLDPTYTWAGLMATALAASINPEKIQSMLAEMDA